MIHWLAYLNFDRYWLHYWFLFLNVFALLGILSVFVYGRIERSIIARVVAFLVFIVFVLQILFFFQLLPVR